MKSRKNNSKKGKSSSFSKLSIFQPNKYKFKKSCPLSIKDAPKVDYKNIKLLKDLFLKTGKFYLQELQTFHKKNKGALAINKKS